MTYMDPFSEKYFQVYKIKYATKPPLGWINSKRQIIPNIWENVEQLELLYVAC